MGKNTNIEKMKTKIETNTNMIILLYENKIFKKKKKIL